MTTIKQKPPAIESDALRANIIETAVGQITILPSYAILLDIVKDYKGIHQTINNLLYEISHPFHNFQLILPQLRSFVLKNINHYYQHERGDQAFGQFCTIFLTIAKEENKKNKALTTAAMEALLAYLDKLLSVLDEPALVKYEKELVTCFLKIIALDDQTLLYMVQGQHPLKKIIERLLQINSQLSKTAVKSLNTTYDFKPVNILLKKTLTISYHYWLNEEDPLSWFTAECGNLCNGWEAGQLFNAISHQQIKNHLQTVLKTNTEQNLKAVRCLLSLPSHLDIVRLYKQIPEKLVAIKGAAPDVDRFSENRKLLFLFRIMDSGGLVLIHEESLREINRSLVQLIRQQPFKEIKSFLLTTFKLLKANVRKYPHTSLSCVQVLGSEVFKRGNSMLVEAFLWETVRFGFQYASVVGVDEDWQPIANPAHLANIRVWLNLIMQEPKWCSTLFSALIINLKLTGTCVKDTNLFQRDITKLLNHPIEPIYNLSKQFTKLMPVFFSEIGAEGMLRDVSTELDETHKRQDKLIHFLRKQSHVESSNLIVDFIEAIFNFWKTKDKNIMVPYLPKEVFYQIKTNGLFIDDAHTLLQRVFNLPTINTVKDLLNWDDGQRILFLKQQQDLSATEINRFNLLVSMYKQVYHKYNLGIQELYSHLQQAANADFPEMTTLLTTLNSNDTFRSLESLLTHLEKLQKIILSKENFKAKESIYYKRHIAVDIPSVYGRYSEKKFDALGLTFRLENLANIYLEKLAATVNLSFITRVTFIRIIKALRLYLRALKVDGISSRRLETFSSLLINSLSIKRFSFTQYLDIFRGLSEGVHDVIYAYYTNIHQNNLSIIIPQIDHENLLAKYKTLCKEDDITGNINRLSEAFLRDLISSTLGLQYLDNFITNIYQTLESQRELLNQNNLDLLMTYNPDRAISLLHQKNIRTGNQILLGNKGFNLTILAMDNKPVPPGFIITTEIFRCWPVVKSFYKARDDFMAQIRDALADIETRTGKLYGNPENPLLLSVRSGAAISMPGMMATIHNVGLNEDIVNDFAETTGYGYLAWDNFRRFLQSWAMAEGINREVFQTLMNSAKNRYSIQVKRNFTPEQMKELALKYQETICSLGVDIPDDPWLQLTGAVKLILDSWSTVKTKGYRDLMDISDSWGTAVIVQTMVFGNLGAESGSGVLFTAHPYRKVTRVALWGDYAPGDQGEDIVSGLVTTYPVSVEQAEIDGRNREFSLEVKFPQIYETLLGISRELVYEKLWNPQEIEFTFEGTATTDLYILQTRDMITIKKKENFNVFKQSSTFKESILGTGIGVSGSAMSGRAVFTGENIRQMRQKYPEIPLVFIRQDTVPEDITEIAAADGLLTARGGQTSHAAVVATRLEKTCVVGCNALKVYETEERCEINSQTIHFGDKISIDGRKGLFLQGDHPIKKEVHILPL